MILVAGGTGFVGRQVVKRLSDDNRKTRVLARTYVGFAELNPPDAELALGDITSPETLPAAFAGVATLVHLVGIIQEVDDATFETIHVEGTLNLINAAQKSNVRKIIYVSALGVREHAASRYHQSKYKAEQIVKNSGIAYVIFRPSVMYGQGGEFINMLLNMMKSPLIPLIGGGGNKMQPLFVGDLALCLAKSVSMAETNNKIFEIAGPEPMTYKEMIRLIIKVKKIRRCLFNLPFFLVKPLVAMMEMVVSQPPLTSDQLIMLREDNVAGTDLVTETFGVELVRMVSWLTENV